MKPRFRIVFSLSIAAIAVGYIVFHHHVGPEAPEAERRILVLAAASLENSLAEIAELYRAESNRPIELGFASSAVIARQLAGGAEADVYISANADWVKYLQEKGVVEPGRTRKILTNRLALVVPVEGAFRMSEAVTGTVDPRLSGRLVATAQLDSTPAGIYAAEALKSLDWSDALSDSIVQGRSVRDALRLVEMGEAGAGIVYASDAKTSTRAVLAYTFPASLHSKILYYAATIGPRKKEVENFVEFLTGQTASAVFRRNGFTPLERPQNAPDQTDHREKN